MLADTQAKVLLTQKSLVEALPKHHGQVICLDTDWGTIEQEAKTNLGAEGTANQFGLCDVHLRFYRTSQRGQGEPSQCGPTGQRDQLCPLDGRGSLSAICSHFV